MRALSTSAMLALALLGCESSAPSELHVDSGRVRLHYEPESPPCSGAAAYLDSVLARQASFLGVVPPQRVDYHFRPSWDNTPCGPGAEGCTDSVTGEIWSQRPDHVHELVHALRPGAGASFFTEGEAVALGGPDIDVPPNDDVAIDTVIAEPDLPLSHYALAGDFVSFLLSRDGPKPLGRLLDSVPHGGSALEIRAAFAAEYGQSLDQALVDRAASGLVFDQSRLSFPECSDAALPLNEGVSRLTVDVGCAAEGTGPVGLHAIVTRTASFDVPAAGAYRIDLRSNHGAAQLRRCVSGFPIRYVYTAKPGVALSGQAPTVFTALDAGRHYVRLLSQDGGTAAFDFAAAPTSAAAGTCPAPASLLIPAQTDGIYVAAPADGPFVAAVRVETSRSGVVVADQSELSLCVDDCDLDACPALEAGAMIELVPGHDYVLVVRTTRPGKVAGVAFP
jgi:hypothetical protein